jgi:hypothetical protein
MNAPTDVRALLVLTTDEDALLSAIVVRHHPRRRRLSDMPPLYASAHVRTLIRREYAQRLTAFHATDAERQQLVLASLAEKVESLF